MSIILLAEDDERLAELVKDYLENHGFKVMVEPQGLSVPRQVQSLTPDLLILDIMLPGKDGISICKEVREYYQGPILMLTARDTDADQLLGFDVGADDYVIKPVEPGVLLARINALLRRGARSDSEQSDLQFGCLTINTASRQVQLAGDVIPLSTHEYELLIAMAGQAGKILSREYLFNTICSRPYDGLDRTVDVRMSHLRKKLGDNPDRPERLKTVWGKGYLFAGDAW